MTDTETTTYRMLIVDDDPDISAALQDYFEINDYVVVTAADGDEEELAEAPLEEALRRRLRSVKFLAWQQAQL